MRQNHFNLKNRPKDLGPANVVWSGDVYPRYFDRTNEWFESFEKRQRHIRDNAGEWLDQNIQEIEKRADSNYRISPPTKRTLKEMLRCFDVELLRFFIEKEILGDE